MPKLISDACLYVVSWDIPRNFFELFPNIIPAFLTPLILRLLAVSLSVIHIYFWHIFAHLFMHILYLHERSVWKVALSPFYNSVLNIKINSESTVCTIVSYKHWKWPRGRIPNIHPVLTPRFLRILKYFCPFLKNPSSFTILQTAFPKPWVSNSMSNKS